MSLDYNFEIQTNFTLKQITEIAASAHNLEVDEDYDFGATGISARGLTKETPFQEIKDQYFRNYSFFPNILVSFTQVVRDGFEISQQKIAKSVALLFKETEGKAIFLFDFEQTIAQRLDGDLIEVHEESDADNPDHYDWLVEEFDKAGLKYVRKVLPSPLQL